MAKTSTRQQAAIAKIEKRIVPIEEADPYVKLLAYGRNGSGKTRLAASAPNVLIVDINERGTRSARQFHGAKVFPVKNWEDITYVYWYLKSGSHDYESVALDTITGMQHMCMRHVLGEAEDRDPNRPPSMPDRRAWGQLSELMKPLIWNFRNLPMHVIFTAQERIVGEEEEGNLEHVPDLSPGTRGVAMGAVDIIGRTFQKEVRTVEKEGKKRREVKSWEPRMLVGPHDEFATKDRTGKLGRVVRNPTMDLIIEAATTTEEE